MAHSLKLTWNLKMFSPIFDFHGFRDGLSLMLIFVMFEIPKPKSVDVDVWDV